MKQQNPTKYELKAVKHIHLCVEKQRHMGTSDANSISMFRKIPIVSISRKLLQSCSIYYSFTTVTRAVLDNRLKLELLGSEAWPGFCGVLCNEDISSALVNLSLHVPRLATALFNPHPNTVLESLPGLSLSSYYPPGYPNSRSPRSRLKGHGSISMIPN